MPTLFLAITLSMIVAAIVGFIAVIVYDVRQAMKKSAEARQYAAWVNSPEGQASIAAEIAAHKKAMGY